MGINGLLARAGWLGVFVEWDFAHGAARAAQELLNVARRLWAEYRVAAHRAHLGRNVVNHHYLAMVADRMGNLADLTFAAAILNAAFHVVGWSVIEACYPRCVWSQVGKSAGSSQAARAADGAAGRETGTGPGESHGWPISDSRFLIADWRKRTGGAGGMPVLDFRFWVLDSRLGLGESKDLVRVGPS